MQNQPATCNFKLSRSNWQDLYLIAAQK